jgi:hypothetical protein
MQSKTPWNSIAEGIVDTQESRLDHTQALESPCATCATSPCCTHLPLQTFKVTNLTELDHAIYALNFERIQLGLSATGEWSVYYCYPCRFLDREDYVCQVHNTPEQPQICAHYNPFPCWYKRAFTQSVTDEFLQIDRQRLEFVVPQILFDDSRTIVQVPVWEDLVANLANLVPWEPVQAGEPLATEPIFDLWRELTLNPDGRTAESQQAFAYSDFEDPCDSCAAYCCKTLVFPQGLPTNVANLDYYGFVLGFPGVELGVADDSWSIVVHTTCRHLTENRCSIYGQPDRPLICRYYDAHKCTYRINMGRPRPAGFVRVKLEQFDWLTESFGFDGDGNIVQGPSVDQVRSQIEGNWRSSVLEQ